MRGLALLATGALGAGVALLAYSVSTGEGQVHLLLVFPIFTGTGLAAFGGVALVAVALFLGFLSIARGAIPIDRVEMPSPPPSPPAGEDLGGTNRRFGGVVMLGPFPIVFGSDLRVAAWMMVVAVILTVLLFILFFLVAFRPSTP